MYIHLGQDIIIKTKEIIGIFDMDNTTIGKHTKKYLKNTEKKGKIEVVSNDLPKTFILTEKGKVYISLISSTTLIKRIGIYKKIFKGNF